jgi:hypothetical protein
MRRLAAVPGKVEMAVANTPRPGTTGCCRRHQPRVGDHEMGAHMGAFPGMTSGWQPSAGDGRPILRLLSMSSLAGLAAGRRRELPGSPAEDVTSSDGRVLGADTNIRLIEECR